MFDKNDKHIMFEHIPGGEGQGVVNDSKLYIY